MSPSTATEHNALHAKVGLGLATNYVDGASGHVAAHNLIHGAAGLGLPTNLVAGSGGHSAHSAVLADWLADATPGIRGVWGQQSTTAAVPGWPSVFDYTTSSNSFANFKAAVDAAGTGRKFRIAHSMTFTTSVTPHTNDQFWFDPGVLITGTGLTVPAFTDGSHSATGSNISGVKYVNGSFTGFRNTIACRASASVEVAYCNFTAENFVDNTSGSIRPALTVAGTHIHHCKFTATGNPIYLYTNTAANLIEDCEFNNILNTGLGSNHKCAVACSNITYRHNWCHDIVSTGQGAGLWFDYHNYNILIEWNLIENNSWGLLMEANPGPASGGNDAGRPLVGNTIRYNLIRGNSQGGIELQKDSHNDVYGNTLYRNQELQQSGGDGIAEIRLYMNSNGETQLSDLVENRIHHNTIELQPSIAGQQPKRGGSMYLQLGDLPSNPSKYVSNAANNDWYANTYILNRAVGSSDTFQWCDVTGTRQPKSWAQWQALPQDATGSAS